MLKIYPQGAAHFFTNPPPLLYLHFTFIIYFIFYLQTNSLV